MTIMMLGGLTVTQLEELLEYLTKELKKTTYISKKYWKVKNHKDDVIAELKKRNQYEKKLES